MFSPLRYFAFVFWFDGLLDTKNRLEYVESMVGSLLRLHSLLRPDLIMFHVLHSGGL